MKKKKGFKQALLIMGVAIVFLLFHYAEEFRKLGGNFSDGVLVGFMYGITACISLIVISSWIWMIIKIIKGRFKWKKEISVEQVGN